jgi:CRISPR-associated protein Csm3
MDIKIQGRLFIAFQIEVLTGLHIGGSSAGIEIGGIDNPILRDPITNVPFIPGSSLKGKMRSLLEKQMGLTPNHRIGQCKIHVCERQEDYNKCPVCQIFGVPAKIDLNLPTRLVVRDILLSKQSVEQLEALPLDAPYTEVKTEVAIDRITSAASPRPVERVPAGATFGPGEMVYTMYSCEDGPCKTAMEIENLSSLFESMALVQHDYLGGMGSRGSGKIVFTNINIELRKRENYFAEPTSIGKFEDTSELIDNRDALQRRVTEAIRL